MIEVRNGVTVIVCCHNSAARLPEVLSYLVAQKIPEDIPWEVIIIDNASTDDTSQVALQAWRKDAPVPLRIVYEPRLGLSHARRRGLLEAQYEFVSFIDDDNWVAPDWVKVVFEVISQHPNVGACGGFSEAICEVFPPWWFKHYKGSYAVGPQGEGGDITWTRGFLWGAGLTIRKSAWQQLLNNGFGPLLVGRQGSRLTAGEDSELCFALRLAGWHLWYESRLRLCHFLQAYRLEWSYLRRIHRGFGASTVGHDSYHFALKKSPKSLKGRRRQTWQWQTLAALKRLFRQRRKLLLSLRHPMEGDTDVLDIERRVGRLFELLRKRKEYDVSIREVRDASWMRI